MTGETRVEAAAKSHVTDAEADAVAEFACEILTALRMPQWSVLIMAEPADEDAYAVISPVVGKHVAQLYLCADWMERSDRERMNTVVHEVCHLVHAHVNDAVHDADEHMRAHDFGPFWRRYQRATEYMVDHLAFFICETRTVREAWETAHHEPEERT